MSKYTVLYYYQTKPCKSVVTALSVAEVHYSALKEFLKEKKPKWNYDDISIHKVHEIIEEKSNIFDSFKGNESIFDMLNNITKGKV